MRGNLASKRHVGFVEADFPGLRRDADRDFQSPAAEQPKDHPVKHLFKAAAIALAFAGSTVATLSIATPANAADTVVTFDPGTVRYGYNDGYWDNSHSFHNWAAPEHMTTYRSSKGSQYFDYAHTRDSNQGWIEK